MTQHPSNNHVLGAPPGVPIDECKALPCTVLRYPDGCPAYLSFWQPTPEELALIVAGHPITLEVRGSMHPPVLITVAGDGTYKELGHGL